MQTSLDPWSARVHFERAQNGEYWLRDWTEVRGRAEWPQSQKGVRRQPQVCAKSAFPWLQYRTVDSGRSSKDSDGADRLGSRGLTLKLMKNGCCYSTAVAPNSIDLPGLIVAFVVPEIEHRDDE